MRGCIGQVSAECSQEFDVHAARRLLRVPDPAIEDLLMSHVERGTD
jgi:hypothetical protein